MSFLLDAEVVICSQGLLETAVYLRQQEVLVAQLFGQPPPALRLADSADTAGSATNARTPGARGYRQPKVATSRARSHGAGEWEEPVPQRTLPGRGARTASSTSNDSDSDSDASDMLRAAVAVRPDGSGDAGLLPVPRGRRETRRKPRRKPSDQKTDQAYKTSRRPRPGGPSRRAAGPPYRDDPIGPVGTPEPEPEPEPEPRKASGLLDSALKTEDKLKTEPPKQQRHTNAAGVCGVCGDVAQNCSCYRVDKDTTASGEAGAAKAKKSTAKKKKRNKPKPHTDEPPLAVATSEYDYDAPSSVYLSLRVGCEVRELEPILVLSRCSCYSRKACKITKNFTKSCSWLSSSRA